MIFIVKFFIYFSASFLILTIPVKQNTFFDLLHKITKPATTKLYSSIEEGAKAGVDFTKQLFTNATPKLTDEVKKTSSAVERSPGIIPVEGDDEPLETYTPEESEILNRMTE